MCKNAMSHVRRKKRNNDAFIEGDRNPTISTALKIRDPKTLEEALEEIKVF